MIKSQLVEHVKQSTMVMRNSKSNKNGSKPGAAITHPFITLFGFSSELLQKIVLGSNSSFIL